MLSLFNGHRNFAIVLHVAQMLILSRVLVTIDGV
jgi:hypothetical protein